MDITSDGNSKAWKNINCENITIFVDKSPYCKYILAVEKSLPAKHARLDKSPGSPSSSKESSPKGDKGKTPKSKPHGKGRQSKGTGKIDSSLYPYERRAARVVAEEGIKYTSDGAGCPFPGCDSKGTWL